LNPGSSVLEAVSITMYSAATRHNNHGLILDETCCLCLFRLCFYLHNVIFCQYLGLGRAWILRARVRLGLYVHFGLGLFWGLSAYLVISGSSFYWIRGFGVIWYKPKHEPVDLARAWGRPNPICRQEIARGQLLNRRTQVRFTSCFFSLSFFNSFHAAGTSHWLIVKIWSIIFFS
jgi:hypothetical protein